MQRVFPFCIVFTLFVFITPLYADEVVLDFPSSDSATYIPIFSISGTLGAGGGGAFFNAGDHGLNGSGIGGPCSYDAHKTEHNQGYHKDCTIFIVEPFYQKEVF